ncbi:MAG: succinylglutamate desuccinylase/aspartoacylase family protein [Armatimonadetes bacterium]|nr:succinylglutamate desuccinylase/aspartoacylase family protein [Armatimonadota bacterium]
MPVDGQRPLHLCGLSAEPGSRVQGWLPVGEDWARRPLSLPVALLCGAGPGPIVYLQAVSDGNELNGLAVCRRLLALLDPAELRGALVIVPVANPGAFRAGQMADPRDGLKLNRCFPGQAGGSVSERLAWFLFHELVLGCDLVVDLHQNGHTPMLPEVRVRIGRREPLHGECLELALAFGARHVLDQLGPCGQLARAAPAAGIPAIDPELGGNPGVDPAMVECGVAGVLNLLRARDMLDGPTAGVTPFVARRLVSLFAGAGGLVEFAAELGRLVRGGEEVACVTDIFGGSPVPVLAPEDGVVWIRRAEPPVEPGDSIGALGVAEDD